METIKSFKKSFSLYNKELEALIYYKYDNEYDLPDVQFSEDVEYSKSYLKKFESGEYVNLELEVSAYSLGEEGHDYLGQVHIESKYADLQIDETIKVHQMLENAISKLIDNIKLKIKLIETTFNAKLIFN